MKDGIYKIIFNTNVNKNGQLDGIVVVKDGKLNGGDYVCYYKGSSDGAKVFVQSVPHNLKETNAFNDNKAVYLELAIEDHSTHYLFKGHVKGDKSLVIEGQMNFLSELV